MSYILEKAKDTLNDRQVQLLQDLRDLQALGLISDGEYLTPHDAESGVSLEGVVTGVGETFLSEHANPCRSCHGFGHHGEDIYGNDIPCSACQGKGR